MSGYEARPITGDWGVSKNGNEYVQVEFEIIEEGPKKGKRYTTQLYFTQETNTARSIESLRYCGCTFPGDDITDLGGLGLKNVRLVLEEEEYNGKTTEKIKYINACGPLVQALDDGAKAAFRTRLKGALVASRNAPAAKKQEEELPF